jgi:hypothetical protein
LRLRRKGEARRIEEAWLASGEGIAGSGDADEFGLNDATSLHARQERASECCMTPQGP